MSMQDDFRDEQPQQQGMSTTAKVLLILGAIAGIGLLACCGGVAFVGWKFQGIAKNFAENFTTKNADEIRARTATIVHIDIPDAFQPIQAFDLIFMKQMIYGNQAKGSMVMIIEINQPMEHASDAAAAKQQRQEILRQMRQQQAQQSGQMNTELAEVSSETREFEINGEKIPFEFIKGTAPNGGTPTRQVVGMFAGRQGMVMLMLMVPESDYDDETVLKMIESIRLPGADPVEAADNESEMSHGTPTGDPATDDADIAPEKEDESAAPSESTP